MMEDLLKHNGINENKRKMNSNNDNNNDNCDSLQKEETPLHNNWLLLREKLPHGQKRAAWLDHQQNRRLILNHLMKSSGDTHLPVHI